MTELVKIFALQEDIGDSFFLLDLDIFEKNFHDFISAFRNYWPKSYIAYSFKTNYIPDICKKVLELGGYAEVVSDMELYLAEKVGFGINDIFFNGPYKQDDVIEQFLMNGGNLNVDSHREFDKVKKIVQKYPNRHFKIALRCALDIGQEKPSRFGFDLSELTDLIQEIELIPNLDVVGIHTHLPYRSLESFSQRTKALEKLIMEYSKRDSLEYLSIGGGYMGPMTDAFAQTVSSNQKAPSYDEYACIISGRLAKCFRELGISPKLILEPGSALVANAMSLLAKVESVKNVRGKTYVTVVASTFNMNPTVRDVNRPIYFHRVSERKGISVIDADIVGFTCIEGDCLYHGYTGILAEDDYMEINNVGSYSITMNPSFIRPIPAVVKKENDEYFLCKSKGENVNVFNDFLSFR